MIARGCALLITIDVHLKYIARPASSLLLQVEAAQDACQSVVSDLETVTPIDWTIIAGEEGIGRRRWGRVTGQFECSYQANVRVTRAAVVLDDMVKTPYADMPDDVVKHLMPSRYCHPEAFLEFVPKQFGSMSGGPLIAAMAAWMKTSFTYDNGVSHAGTTATDTFAARAGVCRDYAHVLISMARSVGIPARIVSCYAPHVTPQDFHAVAEVFLDGAWQLVDPTGMATAPQIVRVGVGRDAADVSFMTSYGWMDFEQQSVNVSLQTPA